jgi:hypothetical protein
MTDTSWRVWIVGRLSKPLRGILSAIGPRRLETCALAIVTAVVAYQLFVPPSIGLADNGDFERLFRQVGLAHVETEYAAKYWSYFNPRYEIRPVQSIDGLYKSSTSLWMAATRSLSIAAGRDQIFDIRTLALFYVAVLVAGIGLVVAATSELPQGLRLVLVGLLAIMFTDVGYVAYLDSFYSEGPALCFLVLGMGSGLTLFTRRSSNPIFLIVYFLALATVVTAKPSYVSLTPAFMVFGVFISTRIRHRRRYWVGGGLALALFCIAGWYYQQTPQPWREENAYIGVFMDLLPHSTTPREDLATLGLGPEFLGFSGTTPYQKTSALKDPNLRREFSARISSLTLPLFYLKRPNRLYQLSGRCVKHVFKTRLKHLGYYEAHSGKPPRSQPFGLWSGVRETLFPKTLLFLSLFFATGIAAVIFAMKGYPAGWRDLYILYSFFMFIAVVQFFVAILGGGGEPDLEKHLFMFCVACDSCLALLALWVGSLLRFARDSRRGRHV